MAYKNVEPKGGRAKRPAISLISSQDFNRLVLDVIPGMNHNNWMTMSFSSEHNLNDQEGKQIAYILILMIY